MANAGVDQSNVGADRRRRARAAAAGRSRRQRRDAARALSASCWASTLAVIINDSFGRAWRRGTAGIAIGAAGLPALLDLRGNPDLFGRTLQVSISGFADEIAAAASLVMGQGDEAQPVVLVRGLDLDGAGQPGRRSWCGPPPRTCSGEHRRLVVALSGGVGGAKLALGPEPRPAAGRSADRRQHRRRFRASRPQHLARHRHADLRAGRPRQHRDRAGAGATRPGRSWRRIASAGRRDWFRLGDRDLALHVERTRRLRAGETLSQITADFARRLGIASRILPMSDDPRAHAGADRRRLDRLPGLFRAPAMPAGRARARVSRAPRKARPQPDFIAALERQGARRRDLPVQPLHQHRADPRRARHARRHRRLRRAGGRGLADHRRQGGQGTDGQDDAGARACREPASVAERYGDLLDGYVVDQGDAAGHSRQGACRADPDDQRRPTRKRWRAPCSPSPIRWREHQATSGRSCRSRSSTAPSSGWRPCSRRRSAAR